MEQKLWKCKKCKREFKKKNQAHSCVVYPIKNHFKNKELAKELFEYFKKEIQKNVGPLKIESLPCCIHLVSNYTFGAVWALKDKIRIDFRVDRKIKSKKIWKMIQMSPGRFLYYFEIYNKKEIDKELLSYVKEAYNLNKK
ncbi:MAG: DUF5655 domain-containing protein [Candidatus Pacebacteria bacterium]|nr:DUF5655 domain-containing protein [Candidatus Paceibacterota bacterium]